MAAASTAWTHVLPGAAVFLCRILECSHTQRHKGMRAGTGTMSTQPNGGG